MPIDFLNQGEARVSDTALDNAEVNAFTAGDGDGTVAQAVHCEAGQAAAFEQG
jgi:hypothetical protein